MKCASHYQFDAVGTCNVCGKGLCHECVEIFAPPLCAGCATAQNKRVGVSLKIQLIWMAAAFVIALAVLYSRVPLLSAVGYALMAAFFLPGWSFLGRYLSPGGGYFFATARWMNLALHAALAAMLGVIVGPIHLYKTWEELRAIRETEKVLANR